MLLSILECKEKLPVTEDNPDRNVNSVKTAKLPSTPSDTFPECVAAISATLGSTD